MSSIENLPGGVWRRNLIINLKPPAFPNLSNDLKTALLPTRAAHSGIPAIEDIPISQKLAENHPLKRFILNSKLLSAGDFAQLLNSSDIDLSIVGYHGGAIPAAVPSTATHNDPHRYDWNLWLRDFALEVFALHRAGHTEMAHDSIKTVIKFIGGAEHRNLITSLHFSENNPKEHFANSGAIHCKYAIVDNQLTWCRTGWAHQQIDAYTAFVNTVYRIANIEAENFDCERLQINAALPLDLRSVDPIQGAADHILPAIIKALHSVQIWDNSDVGPWEDFMAWQRATGNGIATSMAKEIIKFHERFGWDFLNVSYGGKQDPERFKQVVYELAANCKATVDKRVPESGFAIECDRRPHDAAMLLMLYPFRADLTEKQEISILRTAYANMGEYGFSRFLATLNNGTHIDHTENPISVFGEPDLFVGGDYHNTDPHSSRNGEFAVNAPGYKPAEWSLFDPLLAGYYYRRYIESGGRDEQSIHYADRHLKRSLAFIVPEDRELFVLGKAHEQNAGRFVVPKGSLPEAMVWDSKTGCYVYNHNNLLMSRAVMALAFERGLEATALFEARKLANAA